MIEESNMYSSQSLYDMSHLQKKHKNMKAPALHLGDKRITKTKVSLAMNNPNVKSKVTGIQKELVIKRMNGLEKVRKQLKFDNIRQQRIEDIETMYEEKTTEEEDIELKQPEDQMIEQPIANQQMEEENFENEKKDENLNFPQSLHINGKFSNQLLIHFLQNEVFLI